jgi:hypothetical protein
MKSMMKELVREMVPVIVDLVTSILSPGSTVQTGSVTQSQEQDACASGQTQASIHVTKSVIYCMSFDLLAANYHIKLFLQAPNTES